MTPETPGELDIAAAELALGVLDGDERAVASRRVLAEPAFAAEVERWRDQLALLVDEVSAVEPGPDFFDRIERSLDQRPAAVVTPMRRNWVWPSIAGVSSLAAAAALALLVVRPTPTPTPVAPQPTTPAVLLAAAMTPTGAGEPMTAVYDVRAQTLRLSTATMPDGGVGRDAELWVIGGDGVPYSLGLLRRNEPTLVPLSEANRRRLLATAVLAISIEPVGGSPTGAPTGPVVAKGPLRLT